MSEGQLRTVDETVCRLLEEPYDERGLIAELSEQWPERYRQLANL